MCESEKLAERIEQIKKIGKIELIKSSKLKRALLRIERIDHQFAELIKQIFAQNESTFVQFTQTG